MNSELLTIQEVSKLLSIKVSKLRSAILKKEITFVKIGRLVRFKAKDLSDFIEKNTKEANM